MKRTTPTLSSCVACALVWLGCASAPEPSREPREAPAANAPPAAAPTQPAAAEPPPPPSAGSGADTKTDNPQKPAGKARRAALHFKANGDDFPVPLIDVVIGGFPTSMMVDTGATHHVIADWVAKEVSLPVSASGDKAADHAGRVTSVGRAERVKISISGWDSIELPLALVLGMPNALRPLGIGGVLAPHLLAGPGRATVLDLRGGAMIEEADDEASKREAEGGGAKAIASARACGGATQGLMLLVQAQAFGEPAWLKLDSGATSTSLFQVSAAGKKALAKAGAAKKEYGAGGAFTSRSVPGAKLVVGELETAVELGIEAGTPSPACPSDGFLGMDILRSCVLVLRGDRTSARCTR